MRRQIMLASLAATLAAVGGPALAQRTLFVTSPNRLITVRISVAESVRYAVSLHGEPALLDSSLGLAFRDQPPLNSNLAVASVRTRRISGEWENPLGKRRHVVDNANETTLSLVERTAGRRAVDLVFRAYNDGVAFRYSLPAQSNLKDFVLSEEQTQFRFSNDPTVWAADYGGYSSSQESEFRRQAMSALSPDRPYGTPLLVQVRNDCWVGITAADLQDWAGLYLSGATDRREEKLAETPVLRGSDPARHLQADLHGLDRLRLVVGDAGDDFTFDHADLGDARLVTEDGRVVPLGTLTPIASAQGYGTLHSDRSVDGSRLRIGDRSFDRGLGTHSKGYIEYDLGGKYARFEAEVGIDAETAGRGSVTFAVFGSRARKVSESGLVARLAPRRDGAGLVKSAAPRHSPWRVLLIGSRPGDLAESDMVLNLSEPCAIGDAAWVKPGKCAWDHWWSGDVKMDTPTQEQYVQFASDMGFPYQLVDWTWYGSFGTPTSDITQVNANLDMPELLRFAKERNVRLFVWLHSTDVDRFLRSGRLGSAFELYSRWGLAGVKIDFMDRDDQEMVDWYYTVVNMAAAHHLMVDFHGGFKPTGMQRAYPNQITREGVLGEEYDKFSARVTPEHDCTLPFTRMLAGPMDYTPGGFLNRTRGTWKQANPTEVQGTRCHELAKFIIFDSPLSVLCDDPAHYRNEIGIDLLRTVPTVWDDTHIVDGFPGEFVVSARRSGREWYVGGMTNWDARTVQLPLRFLSRGSFRAILYQDAPDADHEAMHAVIVQRPVTAGDVLSIRLASGGGFALRLIPIAAVHR